MAIIETILLVNTLGIRITPADPMIVNGRMSGIVTISPKPLNRRVLFCWRQPSLVSPWLAAGY